MSLLSANRVVEGETDAPFLCTIQLVNVLQTAQNECLDVLSATGGLEGPPRVAGSSSTFAEAALAAQPWSIDLAVSDLHRSRGPK